MLLSIYGLLYYFDEDQVLELFAFVAPHKIAVELFGTLGFANKASGMLI
jgi:O-methyltransferase involved in polyketide biosynthesis